MVRFWAKMAKMHLLTYLLALTELCALPLVSFATLTLFSVTSAMLPLGEAL